MRAVSSQEGPDLPFFSRLLLWACDYGYCGRFVRARPSAGAALCQRLLAWVRAKIEALDRVSPSDTSLASCKLIWLKPLPIDLQTSDLPVMLPSYAQAIFLIHYTSLDLTGNARISRNGLKPLEALLARCRALISSQAFRVMPADQKLYLQSAARSIISTLIHRGHAQGRVLLLDHTSLVDYCRSPWISCQAWVCQRSSTPCASTAVLNPTTCAFAGLSMCGKVRTPHPGFRADASLTHSSLKVSRGRLLLSTSVHDPLVASSCLSRLVLFVMIEHQINDWERHKPGCFGITWWDNPDGVFPEKKRIGRRLVATQQKRGTSVQRSVPSLSCFVATTLTVASSPASQDACRFKPRGGGRRWPLAIDAHVRGRRQIGTFIQLSAIPRCCGRANEPAPLDQRLPDRVGGELRNGKGTFEGVMVDNRRPRQARSNEHSDLRSASFLANFERPPHEVESSRRPFDISIPLLETRQSRVRSRSVESDGSF